MKGVTERKSNDGRHPLLLIAGGGTGGHIYPAIAIARGWLAREEGREVVFVGTEYGLEKTIVPREGFRLEFVSVGGLKGKSLLQTVKNLLRLPVGLAGAWRLLGRYRPAAILGVGGYASGPVLLLGALRGIPTLIHEQNAFPGVTNRILARFVRRVAVGFADALPRLKRDDGEVTGNPVRTEFFESGVPHPADVNVRLLVFGGSQGSRVLNRAVTGALSTLAPLAGRMEIVHQTGPTELESVEAAYRNAAFARARVVPYLDAMAGEMKAADLVVSRAGAITIGELAATGRAAVLVPFAQATNNHQELNARVLERAGAAVVITEAELTPERLGEVIGAIVAEPETIVRMGAAAKSLASPDATERIVKIIEQIQRN
ncbi:MAG: undecaprenyldiphospho-muramoylpentapeptide beta-N-acetylglucosaminyltransferase [Thermoanaerobaculia bacterium]